MAALKLRDRDAILTNEGIIFRVYGYSHPPNGYVCDVEYAPSTIYQSTNPKAQRGIEEPSYYKFYAAEGFDFVEEEYPRYSILYAPLEERFLGVRLSDIAEVRRPNEEYARLIVKQPSDELLTAIHNVSRLIISNSNLSESDFGVFGSILHGFHHPRFSDLDLIVYGGGKLETLRQTLREIYREGSLRNEFDSEAALAGKRWCFVNYDPEEFLWHQKRKEIYAYLDDEISGRVIKMEFEPVRCWNEIWNEYGSYRKITREGWIRAIVRVVDDADAPFIPSIYQVELAKLLEGPNIENLRRVLSYVEEFRLQVRRDEEVYVEGNVERVETLTDTFFQITLTHAPRYYEQTLKVLKR